MLIPRGALRALWEASGDPHGRIAVPVATDRLFWDGLGDSVRAVLLAEADGASREPWPQPLLSQWSAYARTGDRSRYETQNFDRNRRIRIAVLAAAIEPSDQRVLAAADGLWLKSEQATWCWPAHDDVFTRGLRVPDRERPFVDLGEGEDAALVGWSSLVLAEALDALAPGLRDRLAAEVCTRVLRPFVERRDWHWEGAEGRVHNWAPWIHSNLLVAAVACADDALREQVFALCVDGIDRYLAQLPADGAIDEGFGYWWQGAARTFDGLALLDELCGGAVRAAISSGELAGVGELVRFPQRMRLGRGWFASFSDAEARTDAGTPWHTLYRAARLCADEDAARVALEERSRPLCGLDRGVAAGLGRMLAELADIRSGVVPAVMEGGASAAAEDGVRRVASAERMAAAGTVFLASIGVGIRRSDAVTVVAKGGHNGENHNHNDLGSVAVAVDGIPLLPDLGRAEYTAQTFSERRYELWNVRSDWHSAPMPRGAVQAAGERWAAPMAAVDGGWRIDLGRAYPAAGDTVADAWTRTVTAADGVLSIVDESDALTDPATRIVVICAGVPERTADGIVVPAREGSRGLLLTHDPADVEFEVRAVEDPYLRTSWGDRVTRMLFAPVATPRWEMRGRAR
ncbi:hypothetical protein [Microbacterium sp. NPDC058345]|uniref:hypothetical protein n=1 Tax=Microbacterium sp. NPDC058345 TaxID=3346455 RepID=UPI003656F777